MATLKVETKTKIVEKLVKVEEKEKTFLLEVSAEELAAIYCVTGMVAGDRESSPRKYLSEVYERIYSDCRMVAGEAMNTFKEANIIFNKTGADFKNIVKRIKDSD